MTNFNLSYYKHALRESRADPLWRVFPNPVKYTVSGITISVGVSGVVVPVVVSLQCTEDLHDNATIYGVYVAVNMLPAKIQDTIRLSMVV